MIEDKPTTSVIIINFNGQHYLARCLRSLMAQSYRDFEVIIVDNASTDGSVEVIQEKFQEIWLIKNNKNLMFAEANNQALEISLGKYFLLLNSDTIVHGDALEQMAHFLDTHPEAGAVTCKLLNPDGSIQYHMHRRFPTFLRLAFGYVYKYYPRFKTKWAREYLMLDDKFDKTEKIEQAAGVCIMVRKDILEHIGRLFDAERFPLYYNDVDLCYRLYKKGFEIYLISNASITHLKGKSTQKLDFSTHMKETVVTSLGFFKKHQKYLDYILLKMGYLLFFSFVALYSLILVLSRKIRFTTFKDRLSLPLSALVDKKIGLE